MTAPRSVCRNTKKALAERGPSIHDVTDLDENGARPYRRAHDQRRDHPYRSPPPHSRGMGGRLRLRSSPLPPDPVRGAIFSPYSVI